MEHRNPGQPYNGDQPFTESQSTNRPWFGKLRILRIRPRSRIRAIAKLKFPISGIFLEGDASDRGRKNKTFCPLPSPNITRHQWVGLERTGPQAPIGGFANERTNLQGRGSLSAVICGRLLKDRSAIRGYTAPYPKPLSKQETPLSYRANDMRTAWIDP